MTQRWKVFSVLAVVISIAMLATPRLMPICTDLVTLAKGSLAPMKCHYTYQGEYILALIALILSGGLFAVQAKEGKKLLSFGLIVIGAIALILPQSWSVGICGMSTMDCNHTTVYMNILAGLLIVTGGLLVWASEEASQDLEKQASPSA